MCGIVGATATRSVENFLIEGLKRLEYRGYDSAGLALLTPDQHLQRLRTQGKVGKLESALQETQLHGFLGIAHTRWATHGMPAERNAHPFMSDDIALVHNGIIENHEPLRKRLIDLGYTFTSETDSETIVHLLHYHAKQTSDFVKAIEAVHKELHGAYALGIISAKHPGHLYALRQGSPLVIGKGQGENFIASDPLALLSEARAFIYLDDGDIADITQDHINIYADNKPVSRKLHTIDIKLDTIERGDHKHYMSKEIAEQPEAIMACLEGRISEHSVSDAAFGLGTAALFAEVKQVHIVACGTSYHAAAIARYWLEATAGIPCAIDIASEFRYRHPVVPGNTLFVCLSQSGETADTLAALRLAKKAGYLSTLAICNMPESSLVREADHFFMTRAGREIGVASTKAFSTQLLSLLLLTLSLGRQHGLRDRAEAHIVSELHRLPALITETLAIKPAIERLAQSFADKRHALFLGRGALYPLALEGALKLKEISYIHAEGYPAGELKHGPLALVDKDMPVIAFAPTDGLFEKLKSNLQEVRARGGELTLFTDHPEWTKDLVTPAHLIQMPTVDPLLAPIIYTIPLQLLAYHVAVMKGTDVDQPRNLAKSVTVE